MSWHINTTVYSEMGENGRNSKIFRIFYTIVLFLRPRYKKASDTTRHVAFTCIWDNKDEQNILGTLQTKYIQTERFLKNQSSQ